MRYSGKAGCVRSSSHRRINAASLPVVNHSRWNDSRLANWQIVCGNLLLDGLLRFAVADSRQCFAADGADSGFS
jgi:hypothetical protein